MVFEDGCGRFLHLKEQRVPLVAALEQGDVRTGADAADTDDLPRGIHELEALEESTEIVPQCLAVRAELLVEYLLDLVGRDAEALGGLAQRDDDRWLAHNSVPAVDLLRELRERLQAVA